MQIRSCRAFFSAAQNYLLVETCMKRKCLLRSRSLFFCNRQKRNLLKNDLLCLSITWLILLLSYVATMSCTLWVITNITSLSNFNSEIITNVSTFLEYKSLVAYKYVRTFKDGSFKEGTAISLNFTICFVGSVLSLILSLISKQLESKKNSHNK